MPIRRPRYGWLFDLGGAIYLAERLIPDAGRILAALRGNGGRVAFLADERLDTRKDYPMVW